MKRGITVTNYLVSGDPEGIIFAYVSNWTGQAIKIPRNLFAEAKNLPEINRPGVYFLFGQKADNPDDKIVYTGEANNLAERLVYQMRDPEKSFCDVIICFSSKDENLSVSHTKHLEEKIISHLNNSSEYRPLNKKEGNTINLPQMVKDEMETFFENMKIVLPTIGYNILHEKRTATKSEIKQSDLFYLEVGSIKATAKLTSNGLQVLKGSLLNGKTNNSLSGSYVNLRATLVIKEVIDRENDGFIFIKDYEFTSPSSAGAVILGYPVNGRAFWKNKSGKSINDLESEKLSYKAI